MKVSIELSPEYSEPYAIIYADKITDNIQKIIIGKNGNGCDPYLTDPTRIIGI